MSQQPQQPQPPKPKSDKSDLVSRFVPVMSFHDVAAPTIDRLKTALKLNSGGVSGWNPVQR